MTNESDQKEVALWAGLVAFFSSLIAVGLFDLLELGQWVEYLGALLVAGITGGSVYAKQRYEYALEKTKESSKEGSK